MCVFVSYCPTAVSSSAPVQLQGIAINSTTIELQWEPPPLADQSGMIHSFLINISVAESGSFYQLTSESNALNISGLHPFYTYNLTVAAVLIYPGPYSAVLTIQMPEDGMSGCLLLLDCGHIIITAPHFISFFFRQ